MCFDIRKYVIAIFTGLVFTGICLGWEPAIEWDKILDYGDSEAISKCVQVDNGNFVSYGGYDDGSKRYYLYKVGAEGQMIWNKAISSNVTAASMVALSTGEIMVLRAGSPFILDKYDSSGNLLWTKNYYYNGNSIWAGTIAESSNGSVICFGCCIISNKGYYIVFEVDSNGAVKWNKIYAIDYHSNYAHARNIIKIEGGYIAAGDGLILNYGDVPVVMQITQNGNLVWLKKYFDVSGNRHYLHGFASSSEGGYIMAQTGDYLCTLSRLNENGDISTTFSAKTNSPDFSLKNIYESYNGNVVLVFSEEMIEINRYGNQVWQFTIDPNESYRIINGSIQVNGNKLLVCGQHHLGLHSFISMYKLSDECYEGPAIEGLPDHVDFTLIEGYQNSSTKSFDVYNKGTGLLELYVEENCDWLSITPPTLVSEGQKVAVGYTTDVDGLLPGVYSATVNFRDITTGVISYTTTINLDYHRPVERRVPQEYGTIQAAIDAAYDHDIVRVSDGIYTGEGNRDLNYNGKMVEMKSVNGAETTIIDGGTDGTIHAGFNFDQTENLIDVTIDGFTIRNFGIGINSKYTIPSIANCIISNNTRAVIILRYVAVNEPYTISNTVCTNNACGIDLRGYGNAMIEHCIITDCNLDGQSYELQRAGGISISAAASTEQTITITDSIIMRNTGGGVNVRVRTAPLLNIVINNCIIANNVKNIDSAAGIYIDSAGEVVIRNSTVANNYSNSQYTKTGGIDVRPTSLEICDSILWGNRCSAGNVQLYTYAWPPTVNVAVNFCDIEGGKAGTEVVESVEGQFKWGPGNIDCDPCFVDIDSGDYHLQSAGWRWDDDANQWTWDDVTSRCIDAGNPGSPLGDEPMILSVDPLNRFGINKRINIGAYGGVAEASMGPKGWSLLADFNNDGIINFNDYVHQMANWFQSQGQQSGDLNRDGVINIADFALLVEDWLIETTWRQ